MSADVYEVTMPKLGETVTEGLVSQWLKQVGDTVAFDDPLFEVSTDKVDSEVPSPYDGVLLEILVNEGDTVPVGTAIARIGEPGAQAAPSSAPAAAPAAQVSETDEPATELAAVTTPPAGNGQPGVLLSPVVRRMAAEKGIDLTAIAGSGGGGRIRREDVEQAIAAQPAAAAPPAVVAAPPATVSAPATAPAAAPAPAVAAPKPAASVSPGDEVVKLSRMRLITADLMVKSLKTSAHVWTSVEVDFEHVEQVRQQHREQFKKREGVSLTYLPFIARAVCDALREFPSVNSSVDIEGQTMTLAPLREPGYRGRSQRAGTGGPGGEERRFAEYPRPGPEYRRGRRRGTCPDAGCRRHERLHVHDHQSRPVRQLRLRAGDQPAECGDPVHGRDRAASGRRGRRHSHSSHEYSWLFL